MTDNKLSIIIPVYNVEKYIKRCIDSVIKQTYKNLEIIVVDDHSPGNISEIIKEYFYDKRIKFVSCNENKGLFRARIEGAKVATGDYITFLDGDDYITVDHYRLMIDQAMRENADVVIGRTIHEDKNGKKYINNLHSNILNIDILENEKIKDAYFEQKGLCYSWHTVWNKIYKKSLWNICMPYYLKLDEHIIMTEDVAFSTILLYFSKRISTVKNSGVFYCENDGASTDSNKIDINKYTKNLNDLTKVFDFVENFLEEVKSKEKYKKLFFEFRKYYSRMWRELGESTFVGNDLKTVKELMNKFCSNYYEYTNYHDHFFSTITTIWNEGIENIKKEIASSKYDVVSFDIFDTLICRNLYKPDDVFLLMEPYFEKKVKSDISFRKIRIYSEEQARRKLNNYRPHFEDINIDEIYEEMKNIYSLDEEVIIFMKHLEISMEIDICKKRKTAEELFALAKYLGKKIVLTSDMYLNKESISKILYKCEYMDYDLLLVSSEERKTKHTSNLFKVLINKCNVKPSRILHIGDNWNSDIQNSAKHGIDSCFFPKAVEVMENKINGISTNNCGFLGYDCAKKIMNTKDIRDSFIYRTNIAIVANEYFDNPYISFNENSNLNADPYFIGYYVIGMHLLSIIEWIKSCSSKYKEILFLSRDGYLPYKTIEELKKNNLIKLNSKYIYVSRKMLLPFICSSKLDFFNLPIEKYNHTPKTVLNLLEFACKNWDYNLLKSNGFIYNEHFINDYDYNEFIDFFVNNLYDEEKHIAAKEKISSYYKKIIDKESIAFDMGYSGRIQSALCKAIDMSIDVLFIHSDYNNCSKYSRNNNFTHYDFYNFVPKVSGAIREHLFSSLEGSSIGIKDDREIIEERTRNYQEIFIISLMHKGAIDFIKKFYYIFKDNKEYLDNSNSFILTLPFEDYLNTPADIDIKIFSSTIFEDIVYGSREDINLYDFIKSYKFNDIECNMNYFKFHDFMDNVIKDKNIILKFFTLLLYDRSLLKYKIKTKFKDNKKTLIFMKKVYRFMKGIKVVD